MVFYLRISFYLIPTQKHLNYVTQASLRRHSDNQAAVTGDVGRGIPSQKHHRIARRRQKFSGAFGGGFHEGSVTLSNETNVKLPELREQTAKPASKVAFIMIVCRLKIHTVLV